MKRSADRPNLTLAQACATDNRLVLGPGKATDKSNDVTAILSLLVIRDRLRSHVTIDAAGTQTAIAQQIIDGGRYTLALDGNQGTTFQAANETPFDAAPNDCENVRSHAHSIREFSGGHSEQRQRVSAKDDPSMLPDGSWTGLETLASVERHDDSQRRAPPPLP